MSPTSRAAATAASSPRPDDLVAFCDDDNTWRPAKLRLQVEALRANPDAALVSCGMVSTQERLWPSSHITFDDLLRSRIPAGDDLLVPDAPRRC